MVYLYEMKCELCHKSEAEAVLHKKENGVVREYYVCGECARREERARKQQGRKRGRQGSGVSVSVHAIPESDVPPPVLDALLNATAEIAGKIKHDIDAATAKCRVCGMTWDEFSDHCLLGCPACYHAFKSLLAPYLKKHHCAASHERARSAPSGGGACAALEEKLREAVERQDFEEAGRLRDEIAKRGGERKDGGK